ncbi:Ig-like domain-containing protein [Streptomyces sp. NPDC060194]|uniref:L,D-transpeptidase n=1 Tax=Streptomyces sp. NPDC060194 TaxID=3347069 RepID=UPI003669E137
MRRTVVALLTAGLLAAGCSTGSDGGADPTTPTSPQGTSSAPPSRSASTSASATTAPAAQLTLTPGNAAKNIGIATGNVTAKVAKGVLSDVELTDRAGETVAGRYDADRTTWTPTENLKRGTAYTLTARAEDDAGKSVSRTSRFTTVSAADSVIAHYTPEDGSRTGVGMQVSFRFDKPVTEKETVESAVTITSSGGQKAVGHWFGDSRLDFRPEEYWRPGSTVNVAFDLDGVEVSPGVSGVQDTDFSFEVGRSQISTVDAATQQMTVERDGQPLRTIPVSTGEPKFATYNGTMVITEQFPETRMESSTVGLGDEYDIPDVPHAQRLTDSGTFIHGNYWGSPDIFGAQATSHGCIGLRDAQGGDDDTTDGSWFYENSLLGDVVVVENSEGGGTVQPDNGLNGWDMDWAEWTAGSALPR